MAPSIIAMPGRSRVTRRLLLPFAIIVLFSLVLPILHVPPRFEKLEAPAPPTELPPDPLLFPQSEISALSRYLLPAELLGKPELTALRTANSATYTMGDGTYAILQDTVPLHYQDSQGAWLPIDPRFAAIDQGWINTTNLVQTSLSRHSSNAKISAGDVGVGWEPMGLEVVGQSEARRILAQPLPMIEAAPGVRGIHGQSVRYMKSWDYENVQDQWYSTPGGAEYTMQLADLPVASVARPQHVELRVMLHLKPGTTVEIDGKPVNLPAEITDVIRFVDANNQVLLLQPPQTYEQNQPDVRVHGSYLLTPTTDPSVLELRVRTPWAWLAAPERQFPIIIDPLFQVPSPTTGRSAFYPNETKQFRDNRSLAPLELGQYNDGVQRLMVKFALPTLPGGTAISRAYLVATPTDVNFINVNYLNTKVLAYALTSGSWLGTTEPTIGPDPIPPGAQTMRHSRGEQANPGVTWEVTELAQSWLARPFTNHGILLRTEREFCKQSDKTCGGFYFGLPSTWTDAELQATEDASTPDLPVVEPSPASGIRLLVYYNGPALVEGAVVDMTDQAAGYWSPSGAPYFHADHEYRVPPLPAGRWQALVARGFGATQGPNPSEAGKPFIRPLQGSLPLDLRNPNGAPLANTTPLQGNVGYILLNGRQHSGQEALLRVQQADGASSEGYDVRLIGERGSLDATLGSSEFTEIVNFDSADPFALWNVTMPPGSTSRVDIAISVTPPTTNAYTGSDYSPSFRAELIPGRGAFQAGNSSQNSMPGSPASDRFGVTRFSSSFTAEPGPYALALAYNGPRVDYIPGLFATQSLPASGESRATQVGSPAPERLTYTVQVRITSCADGSYPTEDGKCERVACPDQSVADTGYREQGGLAFWSVGGWGVADTNGIFKSIRSDTALMIGLPKQPPHIALIGGEVNLRTLASQDVFINTSGGTIALVSCEGAVTTPQPFLVFQGPMGRNLEKPVLEPQEGGGGFLLADPWVRQDRPDLTTSIVVNPGTGRLEEQGTLKRDAGNDSADNKTLTFDIAWSLDHRGWSSLDHTFSLESGSLPSVAALQLDPGPTFTLDTSPPSPTTGSVTFSAIRASAATITQPAQLGGASQPIQVLILPRGLPLPDTPPVFCPASCLDLRAPDDTPQRPNRSWTMPDIQTNIDARSIIMNREGETLAFSADHPGARLQAIQKQFSFKAFKGKVKVSKGKCLADGSPADSEDVVIIVGEAGITIPNIGKDDSSGQINATFKLCQTLPEKIALPDSPPSLRSVMLEFSSSVGIPVGSSPLYITGLRGSVTIGYDYTQIRVGVTYQVGQAKVAPLKGWGEVIIDTRGLVAFETRAKIIGQVDANGKLWVAWNPLDVGLEIDINYKDWLTGKARAHLWKGQGWQGRYSWLPDNEDTHITAQIEATYTIKKGAIFSWWFIDIPPSKISLGIELAFGQFCTNASCTSYEWGVKGKVRIAGYNIGIYYGFDHGFDFILGNDNRILIDQYGGAKTSPLSLAAATTPVVTSAAPQQLNGVALVPITVSSEAEELLFGLGWQAGAPVLSLIRPDGVEITLSNAAAHGAEFISTANSTLVGVQGPLPGAWQAKISNLSEDGIEHYKFIFFANKGAPGSPDNPGMFTAPVQANDVGTGSYSIEWDVPPATPVSSTISLYALRITGAITGNLDLDIPIVKNLPFTAGRYVWNTAHLANGSYQVYAEVDDGINDFSTVSNPDNQCVGVRRELPPARAFDQNRFPGTSVFTATGTILINDQTPPVAPVGLSVLPTDSGLLARWSPVAAQDSAFYLVTWGPSSGASFDPQYEELIVADRNPSLQIGGLNNGTTYGVAVATVDVNDNRSSAGQMAFATPVAGAEPLPSPPLNVTVSAVTATSALFTWAPGSGAPPTNYQIVSRQLNGDESERQLETASTSISLNNLQPGATYSVYLRALGEGGWRSLATEPITFVATSGIDTTGDGLPDDWAASYGVVGAAADPDNDGLSNAEELALGTDPTRQDSDDDDFSDAEEYANGTDPLSATSYGDTYLQPRLEIDNDQLVFRTKLQTDAPPLTQSILWSNVGEGALKLQAQASHAWIGAVVEGQNVQVRLNTTGMEPGFYSGVVRLTATADSDPLIGPETCIRVEAWLSPPDPGFVYKRYLPVVVQQADSLAEQPAPDLVGSISLSPSQQSYAAGAPVEITAVITNTGTADATPFWVDLYINPAVAPTAANQVWHERCGLTPCYGMAWYINRPLAPGESITLTSRGGGFSAGHSIWPGFFAAGTRELYLYVDSWNPDVPGGAVAEQDEGNNRAMLGVTVTGSNPALTAQPDLSNIQRRWLPGRR